MTTGNRAAARKSGQQSRSKRQRTEHGLERGKHVELTIETVASGHGKTGGMGIARVDGFVVFVKAAFPGSRVIAEIVNVKKDYAESVLVSVLQQSKDAVDPPCQYVLEGGRGCGGCKYQEISYEAQIRIKQDQVRNAMNPLVGEERLGQILQPIIGADPEQVLNYRNKMDFSFSDSVWHIKGREGREDKAVGFHPPGNWDKVIDIEHCLLPSPLMAEIYAFVRAWSHESGLSYWNVQTKCGFLRELSIRSGEMEQGKEKVLVNLITSENSPRRLQALADSLIQKWGEEIDGVVNTVCLSKHRTPAAYNTEAQHVLAGASFIMAKLRGLEFKISPSSFFQTNKYQTEKLYRVIEEFTENNPNQVVYDLYCGTGTIGLSIARNTNAREIYGFELVQSAVDDAIANAERNGIENVQYFGGDLAKTLREEGSKGTLPKPDIVVTDPPRIGMHQQCVKDILDLNPLRVIYVSCNPVTQARDLRHFLQQGPACPRTFPVNSESETLATPGYELLKLQTVDMFPNTPHIETVALLQKSE